MSVTESSSMGRTSETKAGEKLVKADFVAFRKQVPLMSFLSYREYLRRIYELIKKTRESYSYIQFAENLGFSKSNVIWLVVAGRRKLSGKTCDRIVQYLDLKGPERKYFLALYEHNNATRPDTREVHFADLLRLKSQDLEGEKSHDDLEYFSEWFHPVIREMTAMPDFKSDPQWISDKLYMKVPPKQVEASIELLTKLGLIRYDDKLGRHVSTGDHVKPDQHVGSIANARYQQKMCEVASEAVTQIPAKLRELNSLTVCFSEEEAMKVSQMLYKVCEEIMLMEENAKKKDHVYQFNLQLFPLTKRGS